MVPPAGDYASQAMFGFLLLCLLCSSLNTHSLLLDLCRSPANSSAAADSDAACAGAKDDVMPLKTHATVELLLEVHICKSSTTLLQECLRSLNVMHMPRQGHHAAANNSVKFQ